MDTIEIKPGLYEHFKGGKALVLSVAKHSEAHHMKEVHYFDIHEDGQITGPWNRPLDMFRQRIIRDGYDGPRFWRIGTFSEGLTYFGVEAVIELLPGADDPVESPPAYDPPQLPVHKRIHDASVR